MPEGGYLPSPRELAQQGVKDMVRISDARMSGTAFGTIVLHATPEAAAGGPLALVQSGDLVRLDVDARVIEMVVPAGELARRLAARSAPDAATRDAAAASGYRRLYLDHVTQADRGCDFDFMLPDAFPQRAPAGG